MGLWELGSESGLPGFRMGITFADFRAEGKYPNLRLWLKSWVMWMRAVWEKFLSIVVEIPSVPGADLVLRERIRCWSSYRFVSWASVRCGGDEKSCWWCNLPYMNDWMCWHLSWDDGSFQSVVLGVWLYQQKWRPAQCGQIGRHRLCRHHEVPGDLPKFILLGGVVCPEKRPI